MAPQNYEDSHPHQPQHELAPRLRASHADREAVVRTLQEAAARGLLTLDETDERVIAAYAARFMDELPRLTADLPPLPAPPEPVAPGWQALMLLAWLQLTTLLSRSGWHDARRALRARPRLAVAAVLLLALLSFAVVSAGEGFHHGGGVEHSQEIGER